MGERLRRSLEKAPVLDLDGYAYFVHPLTDGIDRIEPALLREIVDETIEIADTAVDAILTVEAMGIPFAVALSLETGIPVTVVRKRPYGFAGEVAVGQKTGYSKGTLYVNGLKRGDRVLVVDDVISTGGTLAPLLSALKGMGVTVADVVVLIEKGEGKAQVEKELGVRIRTLARVEVVGGKVRVL